MRVVLDTNTVVSALLWRGTAYTLLVAVRDRPEVRMYSSEALLSELRDVLRRPFVLARLTAIAATADEVFSDYLAIVQVVEATPASGAVPDDPDDDWVIGTAVAAEADLLVSGDKAVLKLARWNDTQILSAAAALAALEQMA